MRSAYVSREGKIFLVQLVSPGVTDVEEVLEQGDFLFGTIPFDDIKPGWWLDDGSFLGLRPDVMIGSDGKPLK